MKKQKTIMRYLDWSFYLIILLLFISIFCVAFFFPKRNLGFRQDKTMRMDDTWTIEWEEKTVEQKLPSKIRKTGLAPVFLRMTLKEMPIAGDSILFWSRQSRSIVTLDKEIIWDSGEAVTKPFVFSMGSFWNCVRLPEDWQGKELCITLLPGIDDPAVVEELPAVYFGTKTGFLYKLVEESLFSIIICVIVLLLSLYYLISGLFLVHTKRAQHMTFLGAFAICIALWMLLECRVMQIFINNHTLIAYLSHVSYELMPVLAVRFFLSYQEIAKKRYMRLIYGVGIALFSFIRVASCAGLWYEHELQFLVRFYIVIAVFALGAAEWSLYKERKLMREKSQAFGLAILLVSTMVELFHFYFVSKAKSGSILQFGFFLFLFYTGIKLAMEGRHIRAEELKRETLARIAYVDGLTQMKNRLSFEEEMTRIREKEEGEVLVMIADIDFLKYINDCYGHKLGDEAICTAGKMLEEVFGNRMNVFRIGGDEFCLLSGAYPEEQVLEDMQKFQEKVMERREQVLYPFSVSVGYYRGEGEKIDEVFRRADEAMYKTKRKTKGDVSLLERYFLPEEESRRCPDVKKTEEEAGRPAP